MGSAIPLDVSFRPPVEAEVVLKTLCFSPTNVILLACFISSTDGMVKTPGAGLGGLSPPAAIIKSGNEYTLSVYLPVLSKYTEALADTNLHQLKINMHTHTHTHTQ